MKKFFLMSMFLSYSILIITSKPKIKVEPLEFNYGVIQAGQVIHNNFIIRNIGSSKLEVKIRATCGCSVLSEKEIVLNKGEFRQIFYEVKTIQQYNGSYNKNFVIESNDEENPTLVFYVKGNLTSFDLEEHNKIRDAINYTTLLEMKTFNDENVLSIFSYKNCSSCIPLINAVISWITGKKNDIQINYFNLDDDENKKNIAAIQKKLGYFPELPIVVYRNKFYCGKKEITSLITNTEVKKKRSLLINNTKVTTLAVFLAGLLDGINPCAFTVIILLVSYLTLQMRSLNSIFLSGIFFILSVFITYFLIGIGFFKFIKTLTVFPLISMIINYVLAGALIILFFLSIFDFIKALKGKTDEMILKLPLFLQRSIRKNIRQSMKNYTIVISSLILGAIVSVTELVCTGQVYFPIIGFMVQNKDTRISGLFYLLLYNLSFILPLFIVFILVYFGISSKKIGGFFAEHVPLVKLMFSFLFLVFAVITIAAIYI
ncbi:MAG: DUF1573 domain-containing protein [Spirochaetes bacterium]|nr:DUF1573 domain-containing protein [Spirochaetota bacterium]